jgi:hypothetical protein
MLIGESKTQSMRVRLGLKDGTANVMMETFALKVLPKKLQPALLCMEVTPVQLDTTVRVVLSLKNHALLELTTL